MSKPEHVRPAFNGPPGQPDLPWLMTTGPVTTSRGVKLAMLADFDNASAEFQRTVRDVKSSLLAIAGAQHGYVCHLMPMPQSVVIEAVISSFAAPRRKKTLVLSNGPSSAFVYNLLERLGRPVVRLEKPPMQALDVADLLKALSFDNDISHIWVTHCEPETGLTNPVREICRAAKDAGKTVCLDASLTLSTLPLSMTEDGIDILLTASGAALSAPPGLLPLIVRQDLLQNTTSKSLALALDLHGWSEKEELQCLPPHLLCALHEALQEHQTKGGQVHQLQMRQAAASSLLMRMKGLGFHPLLPDVEAGQLVHAFLCPRDANFKLAEFSDHLRARGFVIGLGKLSTHRTFTVGVMGLVDEKTVAAFAAAAEETLKEMDIRELRPL